MFSLDRETMMLIALAMCVLGSLYLYSELKSTRNDVSEMKTFSSQMANHLNSLSYYDDGMSEEDDEDYEEGNEEKPSTQPEKPTQSITPISPVAEPMSVK